MTSHDHERAAMNTFHAQRAAIIELAHQQSPALTTGRLLQIIQEDEALAALRARWRQTPDPLDLGESPELHPD